MVPGASAGVGTGRQQACSRGTSKYKGVCWNKKNQRWQTAINIHGRCLYLGSFEDEQAAARVYDVAALMVRGADAKLNFPSGNYYDSVGKLIIDKRMRDTIEKHLQVAATSRLAAYTAKAVAGCPSENVGAAVSAAVAALAHNAAGATAVQDESATAAAVAAAAAAVEAVSKATGLKRQRTVLSLDTARAAKVMRFHGRPLKRTWPPPAAQLQRQQQPQQQEQQQQQSFFGLQQQQFASQLPHQQQQLLGFTAGSAAAAAAGGGGGGGGRAGVFTSLMRQLQVEAVPAAAMTAQQQQQQHDGAVRLLSEAVAAAVAAESRHVGDGKLDTLQQLDKLLQQRQQQQQEDDMVNDSSSTGSPATLASKPVASQQPHATKKTAVRDINVRWMLQQLPQHCVLERIMMGMAGMFGVLFTLPGQQQQPALAAAAAAAAGPQWGAQVWDGLSWHQVGTYLSENEAADACHYVLDLAADCFEEMDSESDDDADQ